MIKEIGENNDIVTQMQKVEWFLGHYLHVMPSKSCSTHHAKLKINDDVNLISASELCITFRTVGCQSCIIMHLGLWNGHFWNTGCLRCSMWTGVIASMQAHFVSGLSSD